MNFKDALEHYRAGSATEEEAALVEAELEKTQLIAEYLDEAWDIQTPDAPPPDYRKVRKRLRQQRIFLILIPVLIVAIIAAVLPLGHSLLYFDPTKSTFVSSCSDFELYLSAYTELFQPNHYFFNAVVNQTGLGRYQLEIVRYGLDDRSPEELTAILDKGTMTFPKEFLRSGLPINILANTTLPPYEMSPEHKAQVREKLEQLPDYISVRAAVSFQEDWSMEELVAFRDQLNGEITWSAIRHAPTDTQMLPLIGIQPNRSMVYYTGDTKLGQLYPAFYISESDCTPELLEQHFESLLQYIVDHPEITDVMGLERVDYYEDVLAYIREQGVKSYGCVVQTSARELLRLLDEGIVTQVWPMDADISL